VNVVVYTVEEAAHVLKISRWKIFDLIRTNQLRSVKIGGLRRIPHAAIDEYITRLMEEAAQIGYGTQKEEAPPSRKRRGLNLSEVVGQSLGGERLYLHSDRAAEATVPRTCTCRATIALATMTCYFRRKTTRTASWHGLGIIPQPREVVGMH
jgi:excisionase family DNA binding protein